MTRITDNLYVLFMYSKKKYKVEHEFGHWSESIEDQNHRATVIDFLDKEIADCRERDIRSSALSEAIEYIRIYNKTIAYQFEKALTIEHPSQRFHALKSLLGQFKAL